MLSLINSLMLDSTQDISIEAVSPWALRGQVITNIANPTNPRQRPCQELLV